MTKHSSTHLSFLNTFAVQHRPPSLLPALLNPPVLFFSHLRKFFSCSNTIGQATRQSKRGPMRNRRREDCAFGLHQKLYSITRIKTESDRNHKQLNCINIIILYINVFPKQLIDYLNQLINFDIPH